jgi:curved DNA-binding protein CbpA
MATIDPYQVLQISPSAEPEVLHAAFRALALKYHPDRDASARAARRMIELNQAYAMVRDPVTRAELDRSRRRSPFDAAAVPPTNGRATAAAPGRRTNAAADANATRLESGRYAGWTLKDLASHDIDYLKWLSRHSSGLRYRREITQILGAKGVAAN